MNIIISKDVGTLFGLRQQLQFHKNRAQPLRRLFESFHDKRPAAPPIEQRERRFRSLRPRKVLSQELNSIRNYRVNTHYTDAHKYLLISIDTFIAD